MPPHERDEGTRPGTDDAPRERRRWPRWLLLALLLPVLGLAAAAGVLWVSTDLPPAGAVQNPQLSVIRFNDGSELARIGVENRRSVELDQVSLPARQAVLAAEDRRFYDSAGISPRGIVRAFWANVRSGDVQQGGSTITQQYARNAFLTQERTWSRKVRELVLAVKLDRTRSKDEILERYLNTVYFGRGAYGIQAAAQTYFGKPASTLTASEGAVLASLLRSPSGYDPAAHPERAQERWRYVLGGMAEQGWLETSVEAQAYPAVRPQQAGGNDLAGPRGYLVQHVIAELEEHGISEAELNVAGMVVDTTFDPRAQAAAVRAVQDVTGPQVPEGVYRALVSVEPGTGRVRAEYGGTDYLSRPFNAVTQGRAQAGSAFKPFVLAAALRDGISLRSRFDGRSPQSFGDYEVSNFGPGRGAQFGRIDLVTATAHSVNTVYVPLGLEVGPEAVAATAAELGVTADMTTERTLPSISLGVTAVHPLDMAVAYATLASGGIHAHPFVVERVLDRDGGVVHKAQVQAERVLDPKIAADTTYALRQVVARGSGRAAALDDRQAAGKTGTTTGNTAAWFVGYTPRLATAVALYSERQDVPLRGIAGVGEVTGGSLPARTWGQYSIAVLGGLEPQPFADPVFVGATPSPTRDDAPRTRQPAPRRTTEEPRPRRTTSAPQTATTPEQTAPPTEDEPTPAPPPPTQAEPTPTEQAPPEGGEEVVDEAPEEPVEEAPVEEEPLEEPVEEAPVEEEPVEPEPQPEPAGEPSEQPTEPEPTPSTASSEPVLDLPPEES